MDGRALARLLTAVILAVPCGCRSTNADIAVELQPPAAQVAPGGTVSFTATVSGTSDKEVAWSIEEGISAGTIDAAGLYTAPSTVGAPTAKAVYHVAASAHADPSKAASAPVTVTQPGALQTGVWVNVTPVDLSLAPTAGLENYGAMDVLVDPARPSDVYAFGTSNWGMWKSTDYGASWTKRLANDSPVDHGQGGPWGEAIEKNPNRDPLTPPTLFACMGYGSILQGVFKSIDGGVKWTYTSLGPDLSFNDIYDYDIDPADGNHLILGMHWSGNNHVKESIDGGRTWQDKGPVTDGAKSGSDGQYVYFIGPDGKTWLAVNQNGSGTFRTTNSGATWTYVGPFNHFHGNHQIFIDTGGAIYLPHENGIHRSADGGVTWAQVSNVPATGVVATQAFLYASAAFAVNSFFAPHLQRAPRSSGTTWTENYVTPPAGMTNGGKRTASTYDASIGKWVLISGNWLGGVWRYVEP